MARSSCRKRNGASADYCGATKLDAAFLSRFPARLSWNIDKSFEVSIAGNEHEFSNACAVFIEYSGVTR